MEIQLIATQACRQFTMPAESEQPNGPAGRITRPAHTAPRGYTAAPSSPGRWRSSSSKQLEGTMRTTLACTLPSHSTPAMALEDGLAHQLLPPPLAAPPQPPLAVQVLLRGGAQGAGPGAEVCRRTWAAAPCLYIVHAAPAIRQSPPTGAKPTAPRRCKAVLALPTPTCPGGLPSHCFTPAPSHSAAPAWVQR